MPLPDPRHDVLLMEVVERARALSPDDKLLEGPRLFDRSCRLMLDGLRHDHPEASPAALTLMLADRLARLRRGQ